MHNKILTQSLSAFRIILISSLTIFTLYTLEAWTGPIQSPPNGNIGGPLTTSSLSQIKDGSLGLTGTLITGGLQLLTGAASGTVLTSDEFGNASWGASSGLPTGGVMYFNLASCPSGWLPANGTSGTPDLRGEFVRGLDSGRGVDAGRTLGSTQTDMVKNHSHQYYYRAESGIWKAISGQYASYTIVSGLLSGPTTNDASTGLENRPRNVALLACIKS